MIYVIATLTIKPGSRDAVIEAAKPNIESTRQEPGCLRYDLNLDATNPNQLVFVEQWKSREDLSLHVKRPHMLAWREAGKPFIEERKVDIIYPEKVENP